MKRSLARLIGVIAITMLFNTSHPGAATRKVVNAATSARPITIAVLSDHYTDEDEFDNDVANFVTYGLLANPYYASRKADLQIESFYESLNVGSQSNYGFNVEVPSQNCVMSWKSDTSSLVSDAVKDANPTHTIVIGDHPYNIGCTEGEWTYVAADAVGTDVLSHELGHGLGKLLDEWIMSFGVSHPGIPLADTRNCYDTRNGATPPWSTLLGAGSIRGCDLFELDVIHAFDHSYNGHHYCLMGATHNAEFCPVCKDYMDEAFSWEANPDADNPDVSDSGNANPDFGSPLPPTAATAFRIVRTAFRQQPAPQAVKPTQPATPPATPPAGGQRVPGTPPPQRVSPVSPTPKPIVRLLVTFDPANGSIVAKKASPITARYTPSYRRLGAYVYEINDGNQTLEVGVIPSNLFRSHSYQGGGPQHQTSPVHPVDLTIQIPDVTGEALKDPARAVSITIYQLAPGVTDKLITPTVFAQLKADKKADQRGQITATQLRNAM